MADQQQQPQETKDKSGFLQSILEGEEEILEQEETIDEEIGDESEQEPVAEQQPAEQEPAQTDADKKRLLETLGFSPERAEKIIASGFADDVIATAYNIYQAYQGEQEKPTSDKQPTEQEVSDEDIDIPIPEELLSDEYDEVIKQSFLKIKEHVKKHLATIKKKLDTIEQENANLRSIAEQHQQAAVAQAFETLISTVLNRPDLFGTADSLTKETLDNRIRLASAMNEIVQGRLRSGRDVPPPDKLVEMAFRLEFGDQIAENVRQDIQRQLNRRKPVFKPTHRTASGTSANIAQLLEAEKDGFL